MNISETAHVVRKSASDALCTFCTMESCASLHKAFEELSRISCVNVKDARRRIADRLIADNSYKF